jgi:hypothetical protein
MAFQSLLFLVLLIVTPCTYLVSKAEAKAYHLTNIASLSMFLNGP